MSNLSGMGLGSSGLNLGINNPSNFNIPNMQNPQGLPNSNGRFGNSIY